MDSRLQGLNASLGLCRKGWLDAKFHPSMATTTSLQRKAFTVRLEWRSHIVNSYYRFLIELW